MHGHIGEFGDHGLVELVDVWVGLCLVLFLGRLRKLKVEFFIVLYFKAHLFRSDLISCATRSNDTMCGLSRGSSRRVHHLGPSDRLVHWAPKIVDFWS